MNEFETKTQDGKTKFPGNFRGLVLDNTDPLKLGRIKIRIFPMFRDLLSDEVPWAVPAMPLGFGGSGRDPDPNPEDTGWGTFAVPDTGTWVWCFFEDSELYQPVYFAEAPNAKYGLPGARKTNDPEDYPKIRVMRTQNGIQIKINDYYVPDVRDDRMIRIDHPSGAYAEILPSGAINVHSPNTITTDADIDTNVLADNEILVQSGDDMAIKALAKLRSKGANVNDVQSDNDAIIRGSELTWGFPTDTVPPFSTSETRRVWVVISSSANSVTVQERRIGLTIPPSPQTRVITVED